MSYTASIQPLNDIVVHQRRQVGLLPFDHDVDEEVGRDARRTNDVASRRPPPVNYTL